MKGSEGEMEEEQGVTQIKKLSANRAKKNSTFVSSY